LLAIPCPDFQDCYKLFQLSCMGHRVEPEKGGEIETKNTTKNIKHYWISQNKPINKTCAYFHKLTISRNVSGTNARNPNNL